MKTLADRLKEARLKADKKQGDVAEAAGIKQPTYQALESGKTKKSAYLPEIAKFLGVDVEWLKTGNGSAPEKSNADISAMEVGIYQSGDPVPDGYVAIEMLFPVDLIKECNVQPSATKVIHVRGESMFPKLKDGQAISIDMSARTIYDGEIYAFQVGDDTKIKYLFNWSDEGKGGFKAVSANPDKNQFPDEYYSPSKIESEGITILGQYWWKQVVKRVRR